MICKKWEAVSKGRVRSFEVVMGWAKWLLISTVLCCAGLSNLAYAEDSRAKPPPRNKIIEHGPFIQIPDPIPF